MACLPVHPNKLEKEANKLGMGPNQRHGMAAVTHGKGSTTHCSALTAILRLKRRGAAAAKV